MKKQKKINQKQINQKRIDEIMDKILNEDTSIDELAELKTLISDNSNIDKKNDKFLLIFNKAIIIFTTTFMILNSILKDYYFALFMFVLATLNIYFRANYKKQDKLTAQSTNNLIKSIDDLIIFKQDEEFKIRGGLHGEGLHWTNQITQIN